MSKRNTLLVSDENQELIIQRDTGSGYKAGQVLFANESRFQETHYSEPLTTYAVGWRDPSPILDTLNFVAPAVEVGRRFEFKRSVNAEEFLSETMNDLRAIGSDFKKVEYTADTVQEKTDNRGLTYIADLDQVTGNWQPGKVQKLLRRLNRNSLRRAVALLDAGATNTGVTWNSDAGKDPDDDVHTALEAAADSAGIYPNRVLYGKSALLKRRKSYGAQTNAAGFANRGLTLEDMAAEYDVDKVMVSRERFQSSASAKSQILGSKVFMFFAEDGVDEEDPTHIKRFISKFTGEQGGGFERVYVQVLSAKLVAITVERYEKLVATTTLGLRKLTVT